MHDDDAPAVMSYAGLVDSQTAQGQVDEEADGQGSVAALVRAGRERRGGRHRGSAVKLAQITRRRRGAYPEP